MLVIWAEFFVRLGLVVEMSGGVGVGVGVEERWRRC